MGTIPMAVTIGLIAVVALGLAFFIPMGQGGQTTQTTISSTTSTASGSYTSFSSTTSSTAMGSSVSTIEIPTSAYADSVQGLRLLLSISTSAAFPGGTIQVNVTEFNTLQAANNVSKGDDWGVQAALSSCPNTNDQPFGIAVYQGNYDAGNVSEGSPLQVFPITPCPMFIRLVTGYDFQASSDQAVILPGSGSSPMTATVDVNGTTSAYGQPGQALTPGIYTVVGADEWGAMTFLHFQVEWLSLSS